MHMEHSVSPQWSTAWWTSHHAVVAASCCLILSGLVTLCRFTHFTGSMCDFVVQTTLPSLVEPTVAICAFAVQANSVHFWLGLAALHVASACLLRYHAKPTQPRPEQSSEKVPRLSIRALSTSLYAKAPTALARLSSHPSGWESTFLRAQQWFLFGILIQTLRAADAHGFTGALLHASLLFCLHVCVRYFHREDVDTEYRLARSGIQGLVFFAAPTLVWTYSHASKRQLLLPLLAAPIADLGAQCLVSQGLPRSGFTATLLQSNGRLFYVVATACAHIDPNFFAPVLGPLGIVASLFVGLAAVFYEDTKKTAPGTPLAYYLASTACILLFLSWLELPSATLALLALLFHCFTIVAGLHLMWTHWWLITCALAIFLNDEFVLGMCVVWGVGIVGMWYGACACGGTKEFLGFRAMRGLSCNMGSTYRFVFGQSYGRLLYKGPLNKDTSKWLEMRIYCMFWFIDIATHLLPAAMMMRYTKYVSVWNVIVARLVCVAWRRVVSFYHRSLDWHLFWTKARVRWEVHPHCESYRFGDFDEWAVNAVYGFVNPSCPDMPRAHLELISRLEIMSQASCLLLTLLAPSTLKVISAFFVAWTPTLATLCLLSTIIGMTGMTYLVIWDWLQVEKFPRDMAKK